MWSVPDYGYQAIMCYQVDSFLDVSDMWDGQKMVTVKFWTLL